MDALTSLYHLIYETHQLGGWNVALNVLTLLLLIVVLVRLAQPPRVVNHVVYVRRRSHRRVSRRKP